MRSAERALGLVVNCIALWNTIYMERALDHPRSGGAAVREEDVERLSPLAHEHINLVGRYRLVLAEPVAGAPTAISTNPRRSWPPEWSYTGFS